MERLMGVEEARAKLDEYARLKEAATRRTRDVLQRRLAELRKAVEKAGLELSVVEEAIAAARQIS